MSDLTILLLGPPEISLDGQRLTFESGKAIALLAYLAVTGLEHRRAELAALLWPESDRQRARGALRYTLSLLKKGLGDEWLRIERQWIDLNRGDNLRLDITQFHNLLVEGQTHPHPQDEACSACIEPLTKTVHLYRGDFLTGFSLRDSPAFDEWQFFQTESLRRDLGLALERLTRYHAAQAEVEKATGYARRWLNLDPLHEPIYRELMGLYAAAGQWAAATRQYELCVQMLDDEFGVPPSAETTRLYDRLRRDQTTRGHAILDESRSIPQALPRSTTSSPTHNLPRQLTAFVGREQELIDLVRLIENNDVRLLNIVGPGGIGKTRLALEVAAARRDGFADGVYFVSLASLSTANSIVSAIAQAIGFSFSEGREPEEQLLHYLSSRQILLLLDNVEHLLSDSVLSLSTLITTLLQTAPKLKILTTSRVRLNLQVEYVYPVQGLAHPIEMIFEEVVLNGESLLSTARYPALALFQQRAQQVQPDLAHSGLNDVVRICHLTEGMPLAIELAAAMTSVLALPAIATEIERNLDVLATDRQDVHVRHRSMRAVFDSSWQTLTDVEQAVFARLSVFRGSFTREAAAQVFQATLNNLAGLVNKSLLRHQSLGRYEIHELMRQYAAEKLAATPVEKKTAQRHHSNYYQKFLARSIAKWQTNYHPQHIAGIALEIDNLHAGWQWAWAQQESTMVLSFAENLWPFYKARGRFSEAVEMLNQTLGLIRSHPTTATREQQAEIERLLGEAYFGLGQIERSHNHFQQALNLMGQSLPSDKGRLLWGFCGQMLHHLLSHLLPRISGKTYSAQEKQAILVPAKIYDRIGYINYMASNPTLGSYAVVRGLNLAEIGGPSPILAIAYANLSSFCGIISRHRWADYYANLARNTIKNSRDLPARAAIALRFVIYHGALGQWQQANAEGQRALRWYQQLEDRRNWGDCLATLGIMALLRGHFHDCITYGAALQTLSDTSYNIEHHSWAICGQALSLLHLDRSEEALTLSNDLIPLIEQAGKITPHGQAAYHTIIALARLRAGKTAGALQAADRAVDLLRNRSSLNIAIIVFYNHVAEVYLTIWEQAVSNGEITAQIDLQHVRAQAQQVCGDLYRLAWLFPMRGLFAYLRQGHYDWLVGNPRGARRLWLKSLTHAQHLAVPYVEGAAHYQIGRHLPLGDIKRQTHLSRSVGIFEKLEVTYDLAQARAALTEVK